MKINPPKVIIDEKEPFKDALFGREEFAKSLTNLLRNVSENLVIFVNAPWGAGKTTFSQMWRAFLQQQKLEVIYFDAYGDGTKVVRPGLKQMESWMRMNRKKIIPFLCSQLDRFSLLPG